MLSDKQSRLTSIVVFRFVVGWYPAKIKIATADQYQYYVRFFDGEYGQKPRDMVRPLKPFQIHDRIEVQLSVEDDFVPARVIGTHEGNAIVTVIIDENGTTHTVPTSSIRRECNVILFGNGVSSEEFFKNATQPSYEQVTNGTTIRGADVLQLFTELFS